MRYLICVLIMVACLATACKKNNSGQQEYEGVPAALNTESVMPPASAEFPYCHAVYEKVKTMFANPLRPDLKSGTSGCEFKIRVQHADLAAQYAKESNALGQTIYRHFTGDSSWIEGKGNDGPNFDNYSEFLKGDTVCVIYQGPAVQCADQECAGNPKTPYRYEVTCSRANPQK